MRVLLSSKTLYKVFQDRFHNLFASLPEQQWEKGRGEASAVSLAEQDMQGKVVRRSAISSHAHNYTFHEPGLPCIKARSGRGSRFRARVG